MPDEYLLRQDEAKAIQDPTQRLLVRAMWNQAIHVLLGDEEYRRTFASRPFDALLFIRVVEGFFAHPDAIRAALAGELTDLEDFLWHEEPRGRSL